MVNDSLAICLTITCFKETNDALCQCCSLINLQEENGLHLYSFKALEQIHNEVSGSLAKSPVMCPMLQPPSGKAIPTHSMHC